MMRELRTALLTLAVVATALAIVYVRHESRRTFIELQALQTTRDELDTDWSRLQIEYATWADGSRVERLAREELALRNAAASQVMVITE